MKAFSIVVLVLLFLVIAFLGLYLLVVRITFLKVLGRKRTEKRLEEKSGLIDKYQIDICFWDKYQFEELTIVSEDGLKLKGHFLNRGSDKTAILVHGYGSDYREMGSYGKMFVDMGYNVLALENRSHGKSEGRMIGMGWVDRLDILSWINVLVEKNEKCKIVLFGLSMGGSAVCMTLGEDLPKNVVCAISDCAFENVFDEMSYVFNPNHKKLRTRIMRMFHNYMLRAYNFDLKKADAGIALKKTKLPVMFIHGKDDHFVPIENAYKLYEKLPEFRRDLYMVENAGHAMAYATNPRRYITRVREFLKKWGM